MRRKLRFLIPLAVVTAVTMTLINYSSASENKGSASDTLVYAASADPALLDPSLVSDGESIRVSRQIFEGLVGAQLGGTKIVPKLATSWSVSKNQPGLDVQPEEERQVLRRHPVQRRRRLLQLHAVVPLPGAATEPVAELLLEHGLPRLRESGGRQPRPRQEPLPRLQGAWSVQRVADPEPAVDVRSSPPSACRCSASPARRRSRSTRPMRARWTRPACSTRPARSRRGTLWAPARTNSSRGQSEASSPSSATRSTGARRRSSRGSSSCRSVTEALGSRRMQSGEVQAFDDVDPTQFGQITGKYKLYKRPPFTVGYIGINQSIPPMNNLLVRQALAYAINKGQVVKAFYGGVGAAATPVHAAVAVRQRQEGRAGVSVQPGQVEAAAPAGGPEAARQGRLLVSDERFAAVHAEPGEQLPGVLGRPRQGRIRRRRPLGAVAARLPGGSPGRQGPAVPVRLDRRLSPIRPTS